MFLSVAIGPLLSFSSIEYTPPVSEVAPGPNPSQGLSSGFSPKKS